MIENFLISIMMQFFKLSLSYLFICDCFLGLILQSTDRRMLPFLDILIECELKQVISNSAVQQYAGDLIKD